MSKQAVDALLEQWAKLARPLAAADANLIGTADWQRKNNAAMVVWNKLISACYDDGILIGSPEWKKITDRADRMLREEPKP